MKEQHFILLYPVRKPAIYGGDGIDKILIPFRRTGKSPIPSNGVYQSTQNKLILVLPGFVRKFLSFPLVRTQADSLRRVGNLSEEGYWTSQYDRIK